MSSSPAVAYGNVYVGSDDGYLHVFSSSQNPPLLPPEVTIVSPVKQTYNASSVSFVFIVNDPVSWTGYSLDGGETVTVSGNITLANLSNGLHNVTVYASDALGNVGMSETVSFTVRVHEPFMIALIVAVVAVVTAAVGTSLILYFRKRKRFV